MPECPLTRHLRKSLHVAGQSDPPLSAGAVHLHRWGKPFRVIERTGFYKGDIWHRGSLRHDWRATLRAEAPVYWFAAVARVMKRLSLSGHREGGPWNRNENRKRCSSLLLTVPAVTHGCEYRFCISAITNLATEAAPRHSHTHTLSMVEHPRAHSNKKLALTACIRKIVIALNAMLRDNSPWQPVPAISPAMPGLRGV